LTGLLPFEESGSTVDADDYYSVICVTPNMSWGKHATEDVWQFVPSEAGEFYGVLKTEDGYKGELYVSKGCANLSNACMGAAKAYANLAIASAIVGFPADADSVHYLFVDGFSSEDYGEYELIVDSSPAKCAHLGCSAGVDAHWPEGLAHGLCGCSPDCVQENEAGATDGALPCCMDYEEVCGGR